MDLGVDAVEANGKEATPPDRVVTLADRLELPVVERTQDRYLRRLYGIIHRLMMTTLAFHRRSPPTGVAIGGKRGEQSSRRATPNRSVMQAPQGSDTPQRRPITGETFRRDTVATDQRQMTAEPVRSLRVGRGRARGGEAPSGSRCRLPALPRGHRAY